MAVKIDVETVGMDAASHVLHGVGDAVNHDLRAEGENREVGSDGVAGLRNRAGVGAVMAAGTAGAVAVAGRREGAEEFALSADWL